MKAYKCDRCGEYFDNYDYNFVVLPGARSESRWEKLQLKCGGCVKEFDICPDCLINFVSWMLEGKKGGSRKWIRILLKY